jgi:hypothetical protein
MMQGEWPSDEEGEKALKALIASMPSKAQTRYNQRDIKKRNENRKTNTELNPQGRENG